MTSQEAIKRAMQLRQTSKGPCVNESVHGDGEDCNGFSMYSVSIDGVSVSGQASYESCFAEMETRLPAERQTKIDNLRSELALMEGIQEVA